MVEFSCVYCGQSDCKTIHTKDAKDGADLDISACLACGLVQLDEIPDDAALSEFYAKDYRSQYRKAATPKPKHVYRAGKLAKSRISRIAPYITAGQKHLDIGAGGGEFVYLSGRYGLSSQGIDPASDYLEFGRDSYGVPLETKEISDLTGTERFDVITMFHVLEHLAHPLEAAAQVHTLLKKDGVFVVEVPNLETRKKSPTNTYFKAHTTYFTSLSLQLVLSSLFDLEMIESDQVLFAVFRKKPAGKENEALRADSVALSLQRLKEKTMWEYLRNGGFFSLGRKIRRMREESGQSKNRNAREILDQFV